LWAIVASLSFNQPKFCPNAVWNHTGITFAIAEWNPYGLFIHINNTIYATEQHTNRVQVWSSQGGTPIRSITSELNNPGAIFVATNGDIYVDSGNNHRVEMWTTDAENGTIVMNVPQQCLGLFIDINNILYCASSDQHQVIAKSLDEDAHSIRVVAGNGYCNATSNQLCHPNGIFVDLNSNLYVADFANRRIQKFLIGQSNGQTVAGNGAIGTVDLSGPTAVVLDADNYLFIVDMTLKRIVGSGPDGYRCLIGCTSESSAVDGRTFTGLRHLAFDSSGNIFVTDRENDRILKFFLATNSCGMSD
jgi:hypothetical protein